MVTFSCYFLLILITDALIVLIKWTKLALDLDEAMKLPVGVNIRQLKAGIKLASCLCRCNEEITTEVMVLVIFSYFKAHHISLLVFTDLKTLESCPKAFIILAIPSQIFTSFQSSSQVTMPRSLS